MPTSGISDEMLLSAATSAGGSEPKDFAAVQAFATTLAKESVISYFEIRGQPPLGILKDNEDKKNGKAQIETYTKWIELAVQHLKCPRIVLSVDGGRGTFAEQSAQIHDAMLSLCRGVQAKVIAEGPIEIMIRNSTFISGDLRWLAATVDSLNSALPIEKGGVRDGGQAANSGADNPTFSTDTARPPEAKRPADPTRANDKTGAPTKAAAAPTQVAGEPTKGAADPTKGVGAPTKGATEPAKGTTDPAKDLADKPALPPRIHVSAFIDLRQIRGQWSTAIQSYLDLKRREAIKPGAMPERTIGGILASVDLVSGAIADQQSLRDVLALISEKPDGTLVCVQYVGSNLRLNEGAKLSVRQVVELLNASRAPRRPADPKSSLPLQR